MVNFNPNIPQGGDNISVSQGQILNNFTQLNTLFSRDHYAWNDNTSANQALHKKVSFPINTTVSSQSGTSGVLHTVLDSNSVPYMEFVNSLGNFPVFTNLTTTTSGGTTNYSVKIGPIIINWGNGTTSAVSTTPVTFANAFTTSNPFISLYTSNGAGTNFTSDAVVSPSLSGFTVPQITSPARAFRYFAIGS